MKDNQRRVNNSCDDMVNEQELANLEKDANRLVIINIDFSDVFSEWLCVI